MEEGRERLKWVKEVSNEVKKVNQKALSPILKGPLIYTKLAKNHIFASIQK